jgi:Na+/H+-translocating membrane pyrophosphatase
MREYTYLSVFVVLFAIVIALLAEPRIGTFWTTTAFLVGSLTSIVAGYIGMKIAVSANWKTTKECAFSIHRGFIVAYKAGSVLGFVLVGLCLLFL